ncbi:MAG: M20 family metallopeptidase [Candidatus Hermodarchaeota archaeon]
MDIIQWVDENQKKFIDISDQIWKFAELSHEEEKSAKLLANTLESNGFAIQKDIGDLPTAFIASYGEGKPVIAILGEYDALPGLSQDKVPSKQPLEEGGNGHGCQHNLLGTGSLVGTLAVKEYMEENNIKGTIRYYGCPAEESGAGKTFMVKAGVFNDVDIALCWHPSMLTGVWSMNVLANFSILFRFHGRTAHAAADPYNGRSALDAVELMNIGANYLREHIIPDARIHYVITNGGGQPNVVPAEAEAWYYIRAPTIAQVKEIYERLCNVAKGAALMTDTESEIIFLKGISNLVLNKTIEEVIYEKIQEVGAPQFDEEETKFALDIKKTIPKANMGAFLPILKQLDIPLEVIASFGERVFLDSVMPLLQKEVILPGSTDVGDVSWVTPTAQFATTCQAIGTPGHSWQAVAQGGMSIGHKGMLTAGKIMALTTIEFLQNKELVIKAREEFEKKLREQPYFSPIPDDVKPRKSGYLAIDE